jgi:hypothetical protein
MKRTLLLTSAVMLLAGRVSGVLACSCVPPGPPTVELNRADAVFAGKVTDIDRPLLFNTSADLVKVTIEVTRFWKGGISRVVTVTTARETPTCGFPFEAGKEYIVYASKRDGALETNLCTRTKLLSNAQEDLSQLGLGEVPKAEGAAPAKPSRRSYRWPAGGVVLLVIILLLLRRRRRSAGGG